MAVILVGHVTKEGAHRRPARARAPGGLRAPASRASASAPTARCGRSRTASARPTRWASSRCATAASSRSRTPRRASSRRPPARPGSVVLCAMEGSRPLLVEVQALVAPSELVPPRRVANGVDRNRLALVLAVLARHGGVRLGGSDVFVSVAGGVRVDEPGADLAIALALASAATRASLQRGEQPTGRLRRARPHGRAAPGGPRRPPPGRGAQVRARRRVLHPSRGARHAAPRRSAWRDARRRAAWPPHAASRRRKTVRPGKGGIDAAKRRTKTAYRVELTDACRMPGMKSAELEARQEPRLVRALEMVAPGTAVREGLDNIVPRPHGRPDLHRGVRGARRSSLRRDPPRRRLHARAALPAGEDGRGDHPRRQRTKILLGQRAADARPHDPLARDGHAAPHRRARLEADRRAGDRHLRRPRRGVALPRRREVHPRGHPRGAGQGQPGAGHARQVPQPARPGLHAPHRARVRGRRHAARRAHGAAARRARHAHGGGDRALHRRARRRGPPDRDAARGDDGRRGRRQVGARARLHRRSPPTRGTPRCSTRSPGCPTRTCSTSVGCPSCSATTASSTRSTTRSRRAATASSGASRACRGWWCTAS